MKKENYQKSSKQIDFIFLKVEFALWDSKWIEITSPGPRNYGLWENLRKWCIQFLQIVKWSTSLTSYKHGAVSNSTGAVSEVCSTSARAYGISFNSTAAKMEQSPFQQVLRLRCAQLHLHHFSKNKERLHYASTGVEISTIDQITGVIQQIYRPIHYIHSIPLNLYGCINRHESTHIHNSLFQTILPPMHTYQVIEFI